MPRQLTNCRLNTAPRAKRGRCAVATSFTKRAKKPVKRRLPTAALPRRQAPSLAQPGPQGRNKSAAMRWPLLILALSAGCLGTHKQRWAYDLPAHQGVCEAYDTTTHVLAPRQAFTLCSDGGALVVIVPPNGQVQSILSDASSVMSAVSNHLAIPVTPVP